MIKIFIADDHRIMREGLKQIIAEIPDIDVVGEASNGQETIEKLQHSTKCDMVLLDISMPGRDGLDILKQIKVEMPELPVLILSMYSEERYALRALKAGAAGYLTKESASDELVSAIRKVSTGKKYISTSIAEKIAYNLEGKKVLQENSHEILSDREYQVMIMIVSGRRIKEIAEELSLSVKTINTYRSRILEKMNLKSNAELIHYALKNHFID